MRQRNARLIRDGTTLVTTEAEDVRPGTQMYVCRLDDSSPSYAPHARRATGLAAAALMRRVLLIMVLAAAATLALAGSSRATFPGRNGRIVFARAVTDQPGEGNSQLYELDLTSGRSRNLSRSTAYDDRDLALSRDGTRIAFVRAPASGQGEGQLWSMRRDGSAQRRLVSSLDVSGELAWSPDGTKISFIVTSRPEGTDSLWVVDADGGGLRQLTSFWTEDPRWAPDGSLIAFAGREDAAVEEALHVGVVGAGGAGLRWLTPTPAAYDHLRSESSPSWSPDGKQLAFVRGNALVLIGADGSGERTLTAETTNTGSPVELGSAQWSPRGDEIGFVDEDRRLELIHPDGSDLRTLALHAGGYAWSPAGERVVYVQAVANSVREVLVLQPLQGPGRFLRLPALGVRPTGGPAWSPSGKSLFYADVRGHQDFELFSIPPHGGRQRQLTRDNVDDVEPAFSADGRRIAFVRSAAFGDATSSLYMMDADGSHLRRLTRSTGGSLSDPGAAEDYSPSWAPDNARLVFARFREGKMNAIVVLDTRMGRIRTLASGVGIDSAGSPDAIDPTWSPDGRLIAFAAANTLQIIRPDGRGTRTLFRIGTAADTAVSRPSWSPDGRSIAFALTRYNGNGYPIGGSELVIARTGGRTRTLSCPFRGDDEFNPGVVWTSWSPDRTALLGENGAIWVCPLNGFRPYRLAAGIEPDWQPLR
jgi:Tol biopolymer transport system component